MFPELDFKRMPVTMTIAGIAIAIEIASVLRPEMRNILYYDWRLGIRSFIWSGELWCPVTTTLLHINLLHAGFNIYWIIIFGHVLERYFGSLRFLGLCLLLAYTSSQVPFLINNLDTPWREQIGGVGLSGVLYGLFGILWVGRLWKPEFHRVCPDQVVQLFIFWFFLCIVITWMEMMNIGNIAHGTGLFFGLLYGMAHFDTVRRLQWLTIAVCLTLLVLATLIACPGHNLYEDHKVITSGHSTVARDPKAEFETAAQAERGADRHDRSLESARIREAFGRVTSKDAQT